MKYRINQKKFDENFLDKSMKFKHKSNSKKFNLFPFTTHDEGLDSFDNILGSFFREIYSLKQPQGLKRDELINKICEDVTFENNLAKNTFCDIIKDTYFVNKNELRCTSTNTYKYKIGSKNDQKISEYLISTICDSEKIKSALSNCNKSNNLLDILVESHLPKLEAKNDSVNYISFFSAIKEQFTKDIIFSINDSNFDFIDMTQLIEYYYFFYTSQLILTLNFFGDKDKEKQIQEIYFCLEWERTSRTRKCYTEGWRKVDNKLDTMLSHAVLLTMLNSTEQKNTYTYYDLLSLYEMADKEERTAMFSEIERLKKNYTTVYILPDGNFEYEEHNYNDDNLQSLICGFHSDIKLQFYSTDRNRANEIYKSSFYKFCKNNFLQNRKVNGLMLVLNEEQLVLLTKIILGNNKQIQLNDLFSEFKKRGICMDNVTKDCVVEFYEKLNLIEKKSDSGDAQYVKGIL